MIKNTVTKVVCGHCQKVLQDVPDTDKENPNVVIETVIDLCPEVSYADKEKVLQKLKDKKGGKSGNDHNRR